MTATIQLEIFDLKTGAKASLPVKGNWWPDLYLKKGRLLQQITPEQCGPLREKYNAGRGASEIRKDIILHDATGSRIGHVSYNGRVWLKDIEGDIEIPTQGRKTAEQRELEGWQ
jgi:hypothetical protein